MSDGHKERYLRLDEVLNENAIRCGLIDRTPGGGFLITADRGATDIYALGLDVP